MYGRMVQIRWGPIEGYKQSHLCSALTLPERRPRLKVKGQATPQMRVMVNYFDWFSILRVFN